MHFLADCPGPLIPVISILRTDGVAPEISNVQSASIDVGRQGVGDSKSWNFVSDSLGVSGNPLALLRPYFIEGCTFLPFWPVLQMGAVSSRKVDLPALPPTKVGPRHWTAQRRTGSQGNGWPQRVYRDDVGQGATLTLKLPRKPGNRPDSGQMNHEDAQLVCENPLNATCTSTTT